MSAATYHVLTVGPALILALKYFLTILTMGLKAACLNLSNTSRCPVVEGLSGYPNCHMARTEVLSKPREYISMNMSQLCFQLGARTRDILKTHARQVILMCVST